MSDNERLHWKASFARGACVCERKFRFKPIIQYDVCVCVYAFDAGVHFLCSKTTNGAAIFLVSFQVCTQILQMLHFRVSPPPTNDVFVAVIFQYPKWSRKHYTQTNTSRYIIDEFILQDQNQQNITPTTISADCVWCVQRCSERKVVMRRPLSPPKIKTNNNGASLFNIIIIVFGVVDLLLQAHNINTYSTARHTYVRCVCVWHDAFLKWKFIHSTKYTKKIIADTPFLFAIAIIPSIITEDVVSRRKSMPFHLIPTTTTFSATIWMFGSHAKTISYLRFGVCTPIPRCKIIFIVYTR